MPSACGFESHYPHHEKTTFVRRTNAVFFWNEVRLSARQIHHRGNASASGEAAKLLKILKITIFLYSQLERLKFVYRVCAVPLPPSLREVDSPKAKTEGVL